MKVRVVLVACCLALTAASLCLEKEKSTQTVGWVQQIKEWVIVTKVKLTPAVLSKEIKNSNREGVVAWAAWLVDNSTKAATGYQMPQQISKDTMHALTSGQLDVRYHGPTLAHRVFVQHPVLSILCMVMSIAVLHTGVLYALYHCYGTSLF